MSGLKPKMVDYSIMKELQRWGNILPIINKFESNDFEYVLNIKSEIISLIKNYDIEIFDVNSALSVLNSNITLEIM